VRTSPRFVVRAHGRQTEPSELEANLTGFTSGRSDERRGVTEETQGVNGLARDPNLRTRPVEAASTMRNLSYLRRASSTCLTHVRVGSRVLEIGVGARPGHSLQRASSHRWDYAEDGGGVSLVLPRISGGQRFDLSAFRLFFDNVVMAFNTIAHCLVRPPADASRRSERLNRRGIDFLSPIREGAEAPAWNENGCIDRGAHWGGLRPLAIGHAGPRASGKAGG
jgi:hypothetical protein